MSMMGEEVNSKEIYVVGGRRIDVDFLMTTVRSHPITLRMIIMLIDHRHTQSFQSSFECCTFSLQPNEVNRLLVSATTAPLRLTSRPIFVRCYSFSIFLDDQ